VKVCAAGVVTLSLEMDVTDAKLYRFGGDCGYGEDTALAFKVIGEVTHEDRCELVTV
jgi:hypothetical protein